MKQNVRFGTLDRIIFYIQEEAPGAESNHQKGLILINVDMPKLIIIIIDTFGFISLLKISQDHSIKLC